MEGPGTARGPQEPKVRNLDRPLLIIGNRRYSSWSLRAWIGLRESGVTFREEWISLYQPGTSERMRGFSGAGRVPILVDGDLTVYDSMAILEYANEAYAGGRLLPRNRARRALVRSVCAEMHAGFPNLRDNLPMDLGRAAAPLPVDDATEVEIGRILSLWQELLERHEGEGPYLFGEFGLADCVYLPVVTRFHHYGVPLAAYPRSEGYVTGMYALPAFAEWREAALLETEILPGMP